MCNCMPGKKRSYCHLKVRKSGLLCPKFEKWLLTFLKWLQFSADVNRKSNFFSNRSKEKCYRKWCMQLMLWICAAVSPKATMFTSRFFLQNIYREDLGRSENFLFFLTLKGQFKGLIDLNLSILGWDVYKDRLKCPVRWGQQIGNESG